jgi:hypothetical protein
MTISRSAVLLDDNFKEGVLYDDFKKCVLDDNFKGPRA